MSKGKTTSEKEFKCSECDAIFDTVSSLRGHCNSAKHKFPDELRTKVKREYLGNKVVPGLPNLPLIPGDAGVGLITKIMADYIGNHWQFVATSTRKVPLWLYLVTQGIWNKTGLDRLAEIAEMWLGRDCKDFIVNELQSRMLRRAYSSIRPEGFLGASCGKIVVQNGTLNLDTLALEPFNPEEYHIISMPVTYDPEADCPRFRRFLWEVLDTKEDMDGMMDFWGNCLTPHYGYPEIPLLTGDGANGKSTLLAVLRLFLGSENVVGCTPQQLEDDRYKMAELHGKLANIAPDIPSKPLKYTGIIKMLSGGDLITAERKNQWPIHFINRAKLIFSCNQVPEAWDPTDAFHRRIRIFEFQNKFDPDEADAISQDKLVKLLTTPEELSGILNLALAGLRRLKDNGQLTGSKSTARKHLQYVQKSDPVEYMVTEFFERDPMADPISGEVLSHLYSELCDAMKKKPLSGTWFGRKLKIHAPYVEYKKTPIDDVTVWAYHGALIDIDALDAKVKELRDAQDLTAFRKMKRGLGTYEPGTHTVHTGQSPLPLSLGTVVVQQQILGREKSAKDTNEPYAKPEKSIWDDPEEGYD